MPPTGEEGCEPGLRGLGRVRLFPWWVLACIPSLSQTTTRAIITSEFCESSKQVPESRGGLGDR